MEEFYKYPRTYHLPWSLGSTSDDKFHENTEMFKGMTIVISEKMDGENCVGENTIIITDCGDKTIKDICESKFKGRVLSKNIENNLIEFQNIVNHSITETTKNDKWFEIENEIGQKLTLTGDDYVFLPKLNCYRKVSELKEGDDIDFFR